MKKQEYIAAAVESCDARIAVCEALEATAREALAAAADASEDEKTERAKALKSAKARTVEAQRVRNALNSDTLSAIFYAQRVDFAALNSEKNSNTREARKRLLIVCNALALKSADALENAEARYFSAIAAKRLNSTHTLEQARDAMKHETTTQARYMRDFLALLNSTHASAEKNTISVREDSAFVRAMCALFA